MGGLGYLGLQIRTDTNIGIELHIWLTQEGYIKRSTAQSAGIL